MMSNIRMQIKDSIMHYLCDDWNNHKRGKAHKENQALFDRKDGYAIWNNTDLEMIMEKVVKGIYAVDLADHDKQIINKYRDKVKEDVSARLKARKHYLTDDEYEQEVNATRNMISALDYFAEKMEREAE